jgi:hypothetical protein
MATVWIHRALAPDLLVPFADRTMANMWARDHIDHLARKYRELICLTEDIMATDSVQISVEEADFCPEASWNTGGFDWVSPKEAYELDIGGVAARKHKCSCGDSIEITHDTCVSCWHNQLYDSMCDDGVTAREHECRGCGDSIEITHDTCVSCWRHQQYDYMSD